MEAEMRDKLALFASDVLAHLEQNEDWGSAMLDDIASSAYTLGLADTDDRGLFKSALSRTTPT